MATPGFELVGLTGQTIIKEPGTIDGEAFSLKDLEGCHIYLLDHTSMVEVSNVTNSRIFIGPVDGPAIFDNVTGCEIAVAAQVFQAKNVADSSFSLYCATQPTLNGCSNLKIGAWRESYPGVADHFTHASLNLNDNKWNSAKDISPDDSFATAFDLVYDNEPWEIPVQGGADISSAAVNGGAFGFDGANQIGNGHLDPPDFSESHAEHPKMTEVNNQIKERQDAQESHEKAVKAELIQNASSYLDEFYANRKKRIESRAKTNRDSEQALPAGNVEGDTQWAKAVNLVDFGFVRPNGTDLSRFKNVLFTAKSKNVPITSKFGA